jgi:hypothetical protein
MDIIGLTLFPAVTYNLLYNNISKNYGFLPNIIFRLVITLYVYVVSVVPAIPDSLYGFSKLIIPILILGFINVLYKKKTNIVSVKKAKMRQIFYAVIYNNKGLRTVNPFLVIYIFLWQEI